MNFLDNPFEFRMPRLRRIDKIITSIFGLPLLFSKVESLIVFSCELLEACVVDGVVQVRVNSPFVVEIQQS